MYKCNCCGKTFEHPACVSESRGEFWGMPAFEDVYYCPFCDSEDYDDVDCDENGILNELELDEEVEPSTFEYVKYTSDWYYENCDKKCDVCKFYDKKHRVCKWEA